MSESRIPDFVEISSDGMLVWFAEMSARELIFHPENAPREIVSVADGSAFFSESECVKLETILATMYDHFGEGVIDSAYPIFMKRAGQLQALDS